MSKTPAAIAKLATRVLEAWETVLETRDDLEDIIDVDTFLGIQYAELHAEGAVHLTEESKPVLEHAYETLINAQEE